MGWDFQHRGKGEKTIDLLIGFLGDGRNGGRGLVDCRSVGTTFYVAYRTSKDLILGVVALTKTRPNDRYNWGVKFIFEGSGPWDAACPAKILAMLSPIEDLLAAGDLYDESAERARDWRARCAKVSEPLRVGTILTFSEPLDYGYKVKHIVVINPGRRIGRPYTPPTEINMATLDVPERGHISRRAVRIPVWYKQVDYEITGQILVPDWAMTR